MTDEEWNPFDTAMVDMEAMGLLHPLTTALLFAKMLRDPDSDPETLSLLVTPEGLAAWGDFGEARAMLRRLPRPGFGSAITRPAGASDIGYFRLFANVTEGYELTEDMAAAPVILTLIWRPERGMWLAHRLGLPADPQELTGARTSPNEAPGS